MSNTITNNLGKERIQQIIAAIGSQKDNSAQIEAVEYNWRQSHYFSSDQLEELNGFVKEVAEAIARKFADFYHCDFDVTAASITQHFAGELLEQTSDDGSQPADNYCLAFGTDQNQPFGFISIPTKTAIVWTTQLLGDTESTDNSDRDLSQLEKSLLLDIAFVLIGVLSNSCDNYNFQPCGAIVRKQFPLEFADSQELCKIAFNIKKADSEDNSEAYFLMPCSELEPVVKKDIQADDGFSAEDISKAMLGHVQQTPVSVTARLVSGVFSFEEIMSLGVDDILLFDKKVDEPIELILEGRTVFHGRPVKSDSKYAVLVTG